MSRKAKENIIAETTDTLTLQDIPLKEDIMNNEETVHLVRIEPCYSDLFKGSIMFMNTKMIFKILKTKNNTYKIPHYDNISEFKKKYPSIASMFIRNNQWDLEALNNFQFTITSSGITLNLKNDYDLFIYDLLKFYPEVGTSKTPVNHYQKFYIINTEQKAKDNTQKFQLRKKAYSIFDTLSVEDKLYFNAYLGKDTKNISNEVLDSNVIEFLDSKPDEFIALYNKIETVRDYGLVGLCMERGIIERGEHGFYHGDVRLGVEVKDIVEFLNKPSNQDLKLILKNKLKF